MLRTVVLVVLLALGACAPTDRRLRAVDLAERPPDTFDALPSGIHDCPTDAWPVGWAKEKYVEHLCVRFDERERAERHGPFVRYDRFARRTLEGGYRLGLRHGSWRVYREDGALLYELAYENGRIRNLLCPDGQLLTAHRNGWGAWCGPYFRALLDGPAYAFYPETMRPRALGTHAHGRRHGTWVWWDERGELAKVEQWVHGSLAWRWKQACPHVSAFPIPP